MPMTDRSLPPTRPTDLPFSWIVAVLAVPVALVSWRWLVGMPLDRQLPHMAHYAPDLALPLYGHLLLGPLALLLLPVQLSPAVRRRWPGLHRASGYVSLAAILGAGLSSLALLPLFQGSLFAATGFAALAILWIGFALRGVVAARAGDFVTHRAYMLRGAAMTFAAVVLRLLMAPLMMAGWTVAETYQITAWASWLPSLLLVEAWLRRRA
jgi:uncharacterized membrane protein